MDLVQFKFCFATGQKGWDSSSFPGPKNLSRCWEVLHDFIEEIPGDPLGSVADGYPDPSNRLAVAWLIVKEDHVLQRDVSLLRDGPEMVSLAALVDLPGAGEHVAEAQAISNAKLVNALCSPPGAIQRS